MMTIRQTLDLLLLVMEVMVVSNAITVPNSGNWSFLRHPRYIPFDRGEASNTSTCNVVRDVPANVRKTLALDEFYQKYTDAYGIPILSSSEVSDEALRRACYVVLAMLADRKDVRDAIYDSHGRVAVIGVTELTTDIPEHSFLDDTWNDRARGLGGTPRIPVTSVSEENLLCYGQGLDRWYEEDLLIHEFAHSIHLLGMNRVNATWETRLKEAFDKAMDMKLWQSTYAMANIKEYFAEGVQKFFNVDTHRDFIDGVHNNISTRDSLRGYDKELFDLVSEVFPCANTIIKRCQDQNLTGSDIRRSDCNLEQRPMTTSPSTTSLGSTETMPSRSITISIETSHYGDTSTRQIQVSKGALGNGVVCLYYPQKYIVVGIVFMVMSMLRT